MEDLKFRIKARSISASKTIAKTRNFDITIDEPKDLGGGDEAPNPVEYLLAAYSGCLNIVAHLVAKEMNIELKELTIDMVGNLNPAKLFGQSDDDRAGYKMITVSIKADIETDEATKQLWLQAFLKRCPVGDNLKNPTNIICKLK